MRAVSPVAGKGRAAACPSYGSAVPERDLTIVVSPLFTVPSPFTSERKLVEVRPAPPARCRVSSASPELTTRSAFEENRPDQRLIGTVTSLLLVPPVDTRRSDRQRLRIGRARSGSLLRSFPSALITGRPAMLPDMPG